MSWKQTRDFDERKGESTPGSCLINTRRGYSINGKYPNAWSAWQHTQQHTGQPPAGLDVPVFFSYINQNYGHVGVRLADGRFWSDGNYYASIAAYEAKKQPRYVGWGESLNDVRVIEYHDDPTPPSGQRLYFTPNGQTATFYPVKGGSFTMRNINSSWRVLENQGNRVRVNSASAGGDCWVYLKYTANNQPIPGRYVK